MANDWSAVIPHLSLLGMGVFREFAVMPRLVNSDYSKVSAEKGDTINVNIAPPVTVGDMVATYLPVDAPDVIATKVPIELNVWKKAEFKLTDKEHMEIASGVLPKTARNAAVALAEYVNADLLSLADKVPTYGGTPGTTPFGGSTPSTTDATQARKRMNIQKAMMAGRRLVLDPDAMAAAIDLGAFQDASKSADAQIVTEGWVRRKLGFDWFEDQSVWEHIAGAVGGALTMSGASAIGDTTVLMADAGSGFALKAGDRFTIAGDTTQYIVRTDLTSATATADVDIYPALQVAVSGTEVVTLITADFITNLGFNRDAIAFANRPLAKSAAPSAVNDMMPMTDPQTGISMMTEIERQTGQDLYRYTILYGREMVYPDLATVIVG